jgi:aryl-phospho-beta-D-glucosidase BglC (GH1 family)
MSQAQVNVAFQVTNDWGNGYTANVTIRNQSSSAINGWTLQFSLGGTMVNLWNGTWSVSNGQYSVHDAGWNSQIAPNSSTVVGFQLSYSGAQPQPTNCVLNGQACTFNGIAPPPATPTIVISAPTNNATVSGTTTVSATTTGGGILGVQFVLDGTNLGSEDTTSPYSMSWNTTSVSNGTHALKARIRTSSTTIESAVVNVNVQNVAPPTIAISAPTNNTTVSGTTTVSATTTGSGILGVQFVLDGANLGSEDTTSPYSVSWNTTSVSNGTHALKARIRTSSTTIESAVVSVNVQNVVTPPPSGGIVVVFHVTNDWGNGYTADMTIQNQTSSPINGWTLLFGLTNGSIVGLWNGQLSGTAAQYTVRDMGWNGQIAPNASAGFGFQVSYSGTQPQPTNCVLNGQTCTFNGIAPPPIAPTIAISAPTNNATVSGTTSVSATTTGSGILGVQFVLDGANLGSEDTTSPYSMSWNTTSVSNGTHALKARIRTSSTTIESAVVNVNVQNTITAPTIAISAPTNNATVSGTTTVSATTTGSGILGVQFVLDGANLGSEDTTSPYSVSWNTTSVSNGTHALKARIRTSSTTIESAVVSVNVQNVVTPPPPPSSGFLSVSGNHLVNDQGQTVRLTGVNWFGFETSNSAPHGLWSRDYRSMLKQIKALGFNVVRIPWGNQILESGRGISGVTFSGTDAYDGTNPMNQPLQGKTAIQALDAIIAEAGNQGLKIILDNHSRKPDNFIAEEVWYTSDFSEQRWISDWVSLAQRYLNNTTVIGFDLDNEPHGSATWGNSNPATDWNKAAERASSAILAANPNVLIFVEGVERVNNLTYWWGGNLSGARDFPLAIAANKLVYSPHDYGPEVYNQTWFSDPAFPANLPAVWDAKWGYLFKENRAPVLIGEFGIKDEFSFSGKSKQWIQSLLAYMGNAQSWTFWCWNPNSGDTGGILQDNWVSVNQWKMDLLTPYLFTSPSSAAQQVEDNPMVQEHETLPATFELYPPYPNPFNPQTQIRFELGTTQNVSLVVFDMMGRQVQTLFEGIAEANAMHQVMFGNNQLPSGSYWVRLIGEKGAIRTQRVTLVK